MHDYESLCSALRRDLQRFSFDVVNFMAHGYMKFTLERLDSLFISILRDPRHVNLAMAAMQATGHAKCSVNVHLNLSNIEKFDRLRQRYPK